MRPRHSALTLFLLLSGITLLGYFFFPGHTWLQQDSQIYVSILEHIRNPQLLAQDPVATRSHLSFSIYDELALLIRAITGLDFEPILKADMLLFRLAAIFGVFLIATATGLRRRHALIVAAIFALGAAVMGPAVLTVEYEPKPRGSALGMTFLAVGLLANGRNMAAAVVASIAVLYHPPTMFPYWGAYLLYALFGRGNRNERLRGFIPLGAAGALLLIASHFQPGAAEPQAWFHRIGAEAETLMKMRASYTWVSLWIGDWIWHYLILCAVIAGALTRLWKDLPSRLRFFLVFLPSIGLLGVLSSYVLLDLAKWSLMARFQPARALLFVTAAAVICSATASLKASTTNRHNARSIAESLLWAILAFAIPVQDKIQELLLPNLTDPVILRRAALVLLLAALITAAGRLTRFRWAAWTVAVTAPFLLIPSLGQVTAERNMHHQELDDLSAWAKANTPLDSVFLFPDAGKGRQPGIFRVRALRSVYVDWKGGGQINMVAEFAGEWWERYQATMPTPFRLLPLEEYASRGIDYLVLQRDRQLSDSGPVYRNTRYLVFRTH